MQTYYLAVDIGASSGRHILGSIQNGKICLEEIYRFENGMKYKNGHLCWDTEALFDEIKQGMRKCKELGRIPVSMGIDTWGVDFILLDKDNQIIGETVGYRDERTVNMDIEVEKVLSEEEIYQRTGIQKQPYNTIYQLMSLKLKHPEYLEQAESLLMTPDFYHYLLTGVQKQEYTIATTSALVNIKSREWDYELISQLGLPTRMFHSICEPGTLVGTLSYAVREEVGFDCKVIMPASHDTASAVMAVPTTNPNCLYISSGTWSLLGIELEEVNCSLASMKANFSYEGGYQSKYCYLKNIMGLWMIQSVKKEIGEQISFGEICEMASKAKIESIVDCNDLSFLSPKSMIEEVKGYCCRTNQQVPNTLGEVASVIYKSLARYYSEAIEAIEKLTERHYNQINIIGGGSNAEYLNQLTAKITKRCVIAGPSEATAIGNLLCQMIGDRKFADLEQARQCVADSFPLKRFH